MSASERLLTFRPLSLLSKWPIEIPVRGSKREKKGTIYQSAGPRRPWPIDVGTRTKKGKTLTPSIFFAPNPARISAKGSLILATFALGLVAVGVDDAVEEGANGFVRFMPEVPAFLLLAAIAPLEDLSLARTAAVLLLDERLVALWAFSSFGVEGAEDPTLEEVEGLLRWEAWVGFRASRRDDAKLGLVAFFSGLVEVEEAEALVDAVGGGLIGAIAEVSLTFAFSTGPAPRMTLASLCSASSESDMIARFVALEAALDRVVDEGGCRAATSCLDRFLGADDELDSIAFFFLLSTRPSS